MTHDTRAPKELRGGAILIVFAANDLPGLPPRFSKRNIGNGVGNFDQITPIQRRRRFPQRSTVLYTPGGIRDRIVLFGAAPVEVTSLHTQES